MSKRRAPFRRHYEDTQYGRFAVDERTGVPRYVTFRGFRDANERPLYHVIRRIAVKESQRPHRLTTTFTHRWGGPARFRWRAAGITTVCSARAEMFYHPQIADRVSSEDRKCFECFGNVPGAVLPKRRRMWR